MLLLLAALGMPAVSNALLLSLDPVERGSGPPPQAIVVLSADGIRQHDAIDLGPGLLTLDRIRAAAEAAKRTSLPLLVSGGPFLHQRTPLATMMALSLKDDFGVEARWQETRSLTTWENARYSTEILKADDVSRIYLMTHYWHMRRALLSFRHFGMDVVPLPVRPSEHSPLSPEQFVPRPAAWLESYYALHEWVGILAYSLRQ
ncbi:MAG: hypothetical protein NVS2B11_09250 [Acetobacteraceae bacterium]